MMITLIRAKYGQDEDSFYDVGGHGVTHSFPQQVSSFPLIP
jgi:hypothetical protein